MTVPIIKLSGRSLPSHKEDHQALLHVIKAEKGQARAISQLDEKARRFSLITIDLISRIGSLEAAKERMETHIHRVELRIGRAVLIMKVGAILLFTLTFMGTLYLVSKASKQN